MLLLSLIISFFFITVSSLTPSWPFDNIYKTSNILTPTSSIENSSIKAFTYKDGNVNKLQIDNTVYDPPFETIQSIFFIDSTYYLICPKDKKSFVYKLSGNTFTAYSKPSLISNNYSLQCFLNPNNILLVAFIDDGFILNLNYNTGVWETGNKVLENKYIIHVMQHDPITLYAIAAIYDYKIPTFFEIKIKFECGIYRGMVIKNQSIKEFDLPYSYQATITEVSTNRLQISVFAYKLGTSDFHLFISNVFEIFPNNESTHSTEFTTTDVYNSFPLSLPNSYSFNKLLYINNSPLLYYWVTDSVTNIEYWGMIDVLQTIVVINSDKKIKDMIPIEDNTFKLRSVNIITDDDLSYTICPFDKSSCSISDCSKLMIDSTDHNVCVSSFPLSNIQTKDTYGWCESSFFYNNINNACEGCSTYLYYPGASCISSCDSAKYLKDESAKTCTNCKANYNIYYDGSSCISEIPDGFYESDTSSGALSACHQKCKKCITGGTDAANKCSECKTDFLYPGDDGNCVTFCDVDSIYGKDTKNKQCVICSSISKVKYKGTDECIDLPSNDTDKFIYYDEQNGIIMKCGNGCETCTIDDTCTQCKNGKIQSLNFDTTEHSCVDSCENASNGDYYGYIEENSIKKCINCRDSTNDNKYRTKDDEQCISLNGKTQNKDYVITDSGFNLIAYCPLHCISCSYNNNQIECNICENGYSSSDSKDECRANCNPGYGLYNNNCENCKEKNLVLIEGDSHCVAESEIPSNYYESNITFGIYSKCHDDCATCSTGAISGDTKCNSCADTLKYLQYENGNCDLTCNNEKLVANSDKKCINCKDNSYNDGKTVRYLSSSNCITPPNTPFYYIDSNYGIIADCPSHCINCIKKTDSTDSICSQCDSSTFMIHNTDTCSLSCANGDNDDNLYGKNGLTRKCEVCSGSLYKTLTDTTCKNYDGVKYKIVNEQFNIIELCHENCEKCSGSGTSSENKCTECKNNLYLQQGNEGNCKSTCDYYFGKDTIDGIKKCIKCKEHNKYYAIGEQFCKDEIPLGYFEVITDIDNKVIDKCYQNCNHCSAKSTDENDQKCIECKSSFYFEYDESTNINNNNCVSSCGNKLVVLNGKCTTCKNQNNKYLLNNQCIDSVPDGYFISDSSFNILSQCYSTCKTCNELGNENEDKCITCKDNYERINNQCVLKNNSMPNEEHPHCKERYYTSLSSNESKVKILMENEIQKYILEGIINESDDIVNVIQTQSLSLTIYTNTTCANDSATFHNISFVNLTRCINKLKEFHSFTEDTKLIIAQSELENTEEITNTLSGYIITSMDGNIYDLSPCMSLTYPTTYPIDLNSINELMLHRKFMDEKEIDLFDSKDDFFNDFCYPYNDGESDVTLSNRREFFFQNSSFCNEGCNYTHVDFKTARVTCECEMRTSKYDNIVDNIPMIDFPTGINTNNLIVVRCYNLVFNWKYEKNNLAFWVFLILLILEIPAICNLLIVGFQPMFAYLNTFSNDMIKGNPPQKQSNYVDSPGLPLKANNMRDKFQLMNMESNSNMTTPNSVTIYETNVKEEGKQFDDDELNDLAYEDALEYDHRGFFKILFKNLKSGLFIINIFSDMSVFEPIFIKIISLLLNVSLFLVLNAMLFDESYINERFNNKDKIDFGYIMENEIEKSIYASLITVVAGFIVGYATSFRKRFETVMKKEKNPKQFLISVKKIMKSIKCNFFIFIVITFILFLFFWYYCSAFCAVYHKTQNAWLAGCGITLFFCWIFQSVIALIATSLRYIGLKCHVSCCYCVSGYIS